MREIEKVMLLDTRELIVRDGIEFDEYDHYERQPIFEIDGYHIARFGKIFHLDTDPDEVIIRWRINDKVTKTTSGDLILPIYPGEFSKWTPQKIEGVITGSVLELILYYSEGEPERISYNGRFMIWWAEEGFDK